MKKYYTNITQITAPLLAVSFYCMNNLEVNHEVQSTILHKTSIALVQGSQI